MTTSQSDLLKLAKQGNTQAITFLINKQLQPKGITAKVSVKDSCLLIMLEADRVPNQQVLVAFLQKGIGSLGSSVTSKVRVYGRRKGESIPDWNEEFVLAPETELNILDLAKKGNAKAISVLINQWLEPYNISSKVNLKSGCLQVMLEALPTPNQEITTSLLKEKIVNLNIETIETIQIYGKQIEEDFPEWQQNIHLPKEKFLVQDNIVEPPLIKQPLDSANLSNKIYDFVQKFLYQPFADRVETENEDRSIHEIVESFTNRLEAELRNTLEQVDSQFIEILKPFQIDLVLKKDFSTTSFSNVETAIKQLEKVTEEIINFDFPQETDGLKALFSGATNSISTSLLGTSPNTEETMLGAVIGQVFIPVPVLGAAMGGAVSNWLANRRQKEEVQAILSKYQDAKDNFLQKWECVVQEVYEQISTLLLSFCKIKLINYQSFVQAEDFFAEGNQCLEREESGEAIRYYSKAIKLNSHFAVAWNNKGFALSKLQSFEKSIIAFDKAISLNGALTIAFVNKGDALQGLERYADAVEEYRKAIELEPDNYFIWLALSSSLHSLKDYNELLKACKKLTAIDPDNYISWVAKADCLALMDKHDEAIKSFKKALRLDVIETQKWVRSNTVFNCLQEDERFKILMENSIGIDYTKLKEFLQRQAWDKADLETAKIIAIAVADEDRKAFLTTESDAVRRLLGVNKNEITKLPYADLQTIDELWRYHSNEKFGFTIQKEIYEGIGGMQKSSQIRDKFGDLIGWRSCDSNGYCSWIDSGQFDYTLEEAPDGYLPSSLWAGEGLLENPRD